MEKVLVTGATGFIGLHCIDQLLNQGYKVNGSLRSPERKDEIFKALKKNNTPIENLNLFNFNLTEDEGWNEGMEGCDYLLHVASPLSVQLLQGFNSNFLNLFSSLSNAYNVPLNSVNELTLLNSA